MFKGSLLEMVLAEWSANSKGVVLSWVSRDEFCESVHDPLPVPNMDPTRDPIVHSAMSELWGAVNPTSRVDSRELK